MKIRNAGVLVTGASRGLGAALAIELAHNGARMVLAARDGGRLERIVARIRAEGGEAHALVADVGDKEAVYPLAGTATALIGRIDIVIHNASTLGAVPLPLLLDSACEDFQRTLDVNLVGPFRITKALAGPMLLRGEGLIVQITSDAAVNAYPGWGMYGVSKAALDHLGRIWAAELEGTGVRILTLDPGDMDTQMHRDAIPDADPTTLADPSTVAQRIVEILAICERFPNGARLEIGRLREEGVRETGRDVGTAGGEADDALREAVMGIGSRFGGAGETAAGRHHREEPDPLSEGTLDRAAQGSGWRP